MLKILEKQNYELEQELQGAKSKIKEQQGEMNELRVRNAKLQELVSKKTQ